MKAKRYGMTPKYHPGFGAYLDISPSELHPRHPPRMVWTLYVRFWRHLWWLEVWRK